MAVKIGIVGGIRAGKDTVATMLAEEIDNELDQYTLMFAFSDGIHDVIKLIMPDIYDNGKPRNELQEIGQFMRGLKPDVWIDYLNNSAKFQFAEEQGYNVIVTDVRQPNEVKRLQEQGFSIVKVAASEKARLQRARARGDNFVPDMFKHETEVSAEACEYDFLIENTGTLAELQQKVADTLQEIMSKEVSVDGSVK